MLLEAISPGVMSQQQQEAVHQDALSSVFQRWPPPSSFPTEGAEWSLGTGDGFAKPVGKESNEGAVIYFECTLAAHPSAQAPGAAEPGQRRLSWVTPLRASSPGQGPGQGQLDAGALKCFSFPLGMQLNLHKVRA